MIVCQLLNESPESSKNPIVDFCHFSQGYMRPKGPDFSPKQPEQAYLKDLTVFET